MLYFENPQFMRFAVKVEPFSVYAFMIFLFLIYVLRAIWFVYPKTFAIFLTERPYPNKAPC